MRSAFATVVPRPAPRLFDPTGSPETQAHSPEHLAASNVVWKSKGQKCGAIEQFPAAGTAKRSFRLDHLCQNGTGYFLGSLLGEAEQFAVR